MTTLYEATKQALAFTMRDFATMRDFEAARAVLHDDLRAALKQEEEASAWLAERKEHWRKEREKAQATKDQDHELSAALGWPGGISDPVLDRTRLLQIVAAMRLASQQALEILKSGLVVSWHSQVVTDLEAALAQSERDWSLLEATQASLREHMTEIHRLRAALAQQAEPVEPVAWVKEDVCDGQYIDGRPRKIWWECNKGVGTAFYTAPPQRKPLTEEEIYRATGHCGVSRYTAINITRAVEQAHEIKE